MFDDIILLLMGIGLLTLGGNYVTDGAVAIARKLNVSTMMIGLTVVALGSSMPDLVVCLTSTLTVKSQLALGDVVGANIFDVLLVFGVMALFRPLKISPELLYRDMPMLALSSLAIFFCGDDILFDHGAANIVNRTDGLMLLSMFIIFICYNITTAQNGAPTPSSVFKSVITPVEEPAAAVRPTKLQQIKDILIPNGEPLRPWLSWAYVAVGLTVLVIGGNWVVSGASGIALKAGLSESLVGLTVVAFGSASPDLASSLVALFKGKANLAIGNIIGSCILNVFGLLGVCATIRPLDAGTISTVDFATLAGASVLVWLMALLRKGHTLTRIAGAILVLCYLAYMAYLVVGALR